MMNQWLPFLMLVCLFGCGPPEPSIADLEEKARSTMASYEQSLLDEHPRLKASDQLECRAQAATARGDWLTRQGARQDCLNARDLKRQGR